jgi:NitT/TauT family transport system permease protein
VASTSEPLTRDNQSVDIAAVRAIATPPIQGRIHANRWYREHEERALPLISFLLVAIIWEVGADVGILNITFFASPSSIALAGFREIQTPIFWGDAWTSVYEFLLGYTIAVTAGLLLGILMGWFRRVSYFCEPWVNALNATPSIALMPLILIWFGIGPTSKVAIVFITTFVPVVVNIYTGARTVDPHLLRVAASFGASRTFLFRSVVAPSIAPFGFAGARIGVGRAVSGVIVGEFFAAQAGLGFRLFQDANLLHTANVLFGALTITFLALGAFKLVEVAERRSLRWRSVVPGGRRTAPG